MRSMPHWLWAYESEPYAETYITNTKYQHYQDSNLNFVRFSKLASFNYEIGVLCRSGIKYNLTQNL